MPWQCDGPHDPFPTLGWVALSFMRRNLLRPESDELASFDPTWEQEDFILNLYRVDEATGRRRSVRRAVLSRSRGWGKSPLVAAIGIFEALGDAVPDGFDADGRVKGKPWRTIRTPIVQLIGVSEDQTKNAWDPLLEMLRDGAPALDNFPGLEPMLTQVNLPGRGYIRPITSSAWTAKGGKPVCALLDQTESFFPSNGGVKLAQTLVDNATKRGGVVIETPNAFVPGEGSVAENTAHAADLMRQGKTKMDTGFLWDHREAPADTDLDDEDSLIRGLRIAYGDSSDHPDGCVIHDPPCPPGWAPIEDIKARVWDPDGDEQIARGNWLNQITHASDSFVSRPEWAALLREDQPARGDVVVLGFDGSRGRVKGKADATALVAMRVVDGLAFEIGGQSIWEAPDTPEGKDWETPVDLVQAAVREAFDRYTVVGWYGDPSGWGSEMATWEANYGPKLKVGRRDHPIAWQKNRTSVVAEAVKDLRSAIVNGDIGHTGSLSLTRHMLNARKRSTRSGDLLYKSSPSSPNKIDGAYALMLANRARLDALAKGLGEKPKAAGIPVRIR